MASAGSSQAGPTSLRVRVLGGFAVEGYDEQSLGTRKGRALLRRLAAAQGRPVSVDALAEAVWGDNTPLRPNDQISVLVSRLRSVLGAERLPRSDAGYALAADWYDLVELDSRTDEIEERLRSGELGAALAAANAALAVASGAFMPEDDSAWADRLRPAADRLVARARLLAADATLAAGEPPAARAAAQAVLDADPYDEAALRALMRADALSGSPGAALAVYAAARHRLAEDLGSSPSSETEELHTAILRGELPILTQRASEPGALAGRSAEHRLLDAMLEQAAGGDAVAAVVQGDAGMGKSALLASWTASAARSALVISGRCDELGRGLPLQPIIDGLAAHLDSIGREAAARTIGDESVTLDPILGRSPRGTAPTSTSDPETGRAVLFGSLATVLRRSAGDRPLVLAVDDLHLAAAGTAEFLAFALRRMDRVMLLATRRPEPGADLPAATRIRLSPLTEADVAAIVGSERAAVLHERSGGHPLFLTELAAAPDSQLPESIVAAVTAGVSRLGEAAATVETAAACGTVVDVELVQAITARPLPSVLDDLEKAAAAGLLQPRGATLAFRHELVREAIEAATSAPRLAAIHKSAVSYMTSRTAFDPLALARHARLAGDPQSAAPALVTAAGRAFERFESGTAEELLDESLRLQDGASGRLLRARVRLARLDLDAALEDASRAVELHSGVEAFELVGWIAYYKRDFEMALRYADEGIERASEPQLLASCLALSGRIRHTRGQLQEAERLLSKGVSVAPPGIRGVVQVWHAQLMAHRGDADGAAATARRGLVEPRMAHPFAWGHGWFTLAYALGIAGKWTAALDALDSLDRVIGSRGDKRFPPVAANVRGWLLRGVGQLDEAVELHLAAVDMAPGPTFLESHYAALLDLAECHLARGDLDSAAEAIADCSGIPDWTGSMWWRHGNRYRLIGDRLASLGGEHKESADDARAVAELAAERGDQRYRCRAEIVAATIDARAGAAHDAQQLGVLVDRFKPMSGPDGWRDLAELGSQTGLDAIWRSAQSHAASLVADASSRAGVNSSAFEKAVESQLSELHQ
jgi:DNA-binding SARP family transcriptional activator/tetratricopeptide (TPR) repeat protein